MLEPIIVGRLTFHAFTPAPELPVMTQLRIVGAAPEQYTRYRRP